MDLIGQGKPEKAKLSEKERVLLEYVKVLTLEPAQVTDQLVEKLRKVGWNDNEIGEASFNTSLFAFFNRMAEAYGLDYADRGWFPPELRARPAESPARPEKSGSPAKSSKAPGSPR